MDLPSWHVRSPRLQTTVKIAYFTLRKSNLASQRVFCTISMMKGAVGGSYHKNVWSIFELRSRKLDIKRSFASRGSGGMGADKPKLQE